MAAFRGFGRHYSSRDSGARDFWLLLFTAAFATAPVCWSDFSLVSVRDAECTGVHRGLVLYADKVLIGDVVWGAQGLGDTSIL